MFNLSFRYLILPFIRGSAMGKTNLVSILRCMSRRDEYNEHKTLIQECLRLLSESSPKIRDYLERESDLKSSDSDKKDSTDEAARMRVKKEEARKKIAQKFQSMRNNFASSLLEEEEEEEDGGEGGKGEKEEVGEDGGERVKSSQKLTEQEFRNQIWKQFSRCPLSLPSQLSFHIFYVPIMSILLSLLSHTHSPSVCLLSRITSARSAVTPFSHVTHLRNRPKGRQMASLDSSDSLNVQKS